ncbi:hypothetical protein HA909_002651 [Enterococcus faecalis]|nr:hypothetical protein [Enterococcus faecalis]
MISKKMKFSIVLLLSLIITTGFMIGCAGNENKADDKQKTTETVINGKKAKIRKTEDGKGVQVEMDE